MAYDDRKFWKLVQDVWEGDGPDHPSITARLLLVEDAVSTIKTNSKVVIGLLLTILGGVFVDLISRFAGVK
jgi:hypothetical protein